MNVRRVVTGHSPEGKAIVASDSEVEPIRMETLPGNEFHRLWGADVVSRFPDNGAPPPMPRYFPPLGGFRFGMFTVPAASSMVLPEGVTLEGIIEEAEAKLPGLFESMEPDAPGMHTTDTIDFEYVISGRVLLELDDGVTVELGPGDTVADSNFKLASALGPRMRIMVSPQGDAAGSPIGGTRSVPRG